MTNTPANEYVQSIIKGFEIDSDLLKKLTSKYIESMDNGLSHSSGGKSHLPMIPTFITKLPNGTEKTDILACDLGGTSFRCLYIKLKGNSKFTTEMKKWEIPSDYLAEEGADLPENAFFDYLANKIVSFVQYHNSNDENKDLLSTKKNFNLGFTFSYPVEQTALNAGNLIRWTKGFEIKSVVGKDIVELLQKSIDNKLNSVDPEKYPFTISCVALCNDTTGTLLSGAYTSTYDSQDIVDPIMSIICGTGFNIAYMEDLASCTKLTEEQVSTIKTKDVTEMCINTESGSFDNELSVLPVTQYDKIVDEESTNPGYHLFEKRISGMFLGEILRLVIVDLIQKEFLLEPKPSKKQYTHKFSLKTEVLSHVEIDDSKDLKQTELYLIESLGLRTTTEQRHYLQQITRAISRRSAYLVSVAISAIIIKSGRLDPKSSKYKYHQELEVCCDGSVVQYYPGYKSMIRHGLSLGSLGHEGERRVHISMALDGSGLGAGLAALTASK